MKPFERLRGLPPRPFLHRIAILIALMGAAAAWWWHRAHLPAVEHPLSGIYRSVPDQRVNLADLFLSYQRVADAKAALTPAGLTVSESRLGRPPSPLYPPREMVTLTIADFRHLGVTGELKLEFFNDRLMEADFRPEDAAAYAPRLHAQLPGLVRGRTGHAELKNGALRVWTNVDLAKSRVGSSLQTAPLVLWQDLRLTQQRDDWDANFGHLPVPAR